MGSFFFRMNHIDHISTTWNLQVLAASAIWLLWVLVEPFPRVLLLAFGGPATGPSHCGHAWDAWLRRAPAFPRDLQWVGPWSYLILPDPTWSYLSKCSTSTGPNLEIGVWKFIGHLGSSLRLRGKAFPRESLTIDRGAVRISFCAMICSLNLQGYMEESVTSFEQVGNGGDRWRQQNCTLW